MIAADLRRRLVRDEVAAAGLEGVLAAPHYRDTAPTTARRAAAVRERPDVLALQLDQLLFGERFEVLETERSWAFGQVGRDGYVGWVERDALVAGTFAPTHRITAARSLAHAEPSPRAPHLASLAMNALVRAEGQRDGFVRAEGLGWIPTGHLAPVGRFETDPAGVAERFLGAPYLWGGRGADGIDCSGLVQQALFACGRACPRDSDQQAELGRAVAPETLRRGDLVAWPGHIGMVLDEARLIHASGRAMMVVVEPLDEAVAARTETTGAPGAFRRVWP